MNLNYQNTELVPEPTLLIVDDEVMQEVMLKNPILRKQIKVIFCQSGQECLDILNTRNDISLVLLDLIMPNMNGFNTMEAIRQLPEYVPVIAVSASATTNDTEKAKDFGFEDILLKPLNVNAIAQAFEKYTNQKQINEAKHLPESTDDSQKIIRHLEEANNALILGFRQQDINKMKESLHCIRENTLISSISAIPTQIEMIQKAFNERCVSGAQIIDLTNFIKHFVMSELNKIKSTSQPL